MPTEPVNRPSVSREEVTRLAPSPTGALHLDNARTFLINWAIARAEGWRIILRIEDLDGPRVKAGAIEQCVDTLRWLGIDWDEGPIIQSHDLAEHEATMRRLAAGGLAYPCELTRAEIEAAASAPHAPEPEGHGAEVRFPSELRPCLGARGFEDTGSNWRFVTPDAEVRFHDRFAGPQSFNPARAIGDFVIWTKRAQPSYQLAVVVDDHRQGVTQIVRGDDLLESAARQLVLYRALGYSPEPAYTHLPLVVGPDGRRLAKRHGDSRLSTYRDRGVAAERVVGLIASWSGFQGARREMSAAEFARGLQPASMSRARTVFTPEDDRWLGERSV